MIDYTGTRGTGESCALHLGVLLPDDLIFNVRGYLGIDTGCVRPTSRCRLVRPTGLG